MIMLSVNLYYFLLASNLIKYRFNVLFLIWRRCQGRPWQNRLPSHVYRLPQPPWVSIGPSPAVPLIFKNQRFTEPRCGLVVHPHQTTSVHRLLIHGDLVGFIAVHIDSFNVVVVAHYRTSCSIVGTRLREVDRVSVTQWTSRAVSNFTSVAVVLTVAPNAVSFPTRLTSLPNSATEITPCTTRVDFELVVAQTSAWEVAAAWKVTPQVYILIMNTTNPSTT